MGAPIVGLDNIVESGNGSAMALELASEKYPVIFENYTEYVGKEMPTKVTEALVNSWKNQEIQSHSYARFGQKYAQI